MEHNEAEDILEWLLYHLWLGVDHFIGASSTFPALPTFPLTDAEPADAVYDHFSSGPLATKPILQPFIDLGWVTYVPYNVASSQAQTAAFETFISSFALLSKWLLFADPDEFLVRNTSSSSPQEEEEEEPFVEWFDRQYSHHGGVALPRLAFSSNGHYTRPNTTGLLSSYTETRALDANALIPKIVAQTRYKRDVKGDNIHKMSFQKGRELVDPRGREWGEVVRGVKEKSEVVSGGWEIYMHHYWAKSWEECMGKVKQQVRFLFLLCCSRSFSPYTDLTSSSFRSQAFPGSWRERMGDRFCRQEMKSTEPYNEVEHLQDLTLARYGPSLQLAAERFKRRYPAYQPDDYTLSVLDSFAPVQHVALGPESVLHPGATLVIRNTRGSVGFLEVILSSQDTRVFLPVTYLPSGDASFSLPSSPITASAVPLVYGDLTITLTHPSFPSPTDDPLNTCTTIGHLRERLTPVQLRNVYDETCSFDRPLAGWRMATLTWPRSRYLGTTLFRRFFRISTTPHSAASSLGIDPPPPFAATLPIALSSLTHHGHWQRFPLWSHPPSTPPAHTSSLPRLYTTGRCPTRFDKHYWVMQRGCPDDTTLSGQGGVLRWVPEGATSYAEAALTKEELRKCLHTGGAGGGGRKSRPKRIKLVGEKSTSHLFMAAQCLLDQALPDAHPAAATQHLQFSLIHHQAFSLAGLVPPLSRSDWLDLIAWDRTDDPDAPSDAENDTEEGLIAYPDVVVLSFAHRPTSWGSAASYERGLRSNLEGLIALLSSLPPSSPSSPPPPAPKLLWRDSPAVFASPSPFDSLIPSSNPTLTPSSPAPSPSDLGPSYLNSPRLELFNRLANGVVDQLGIERFENWEMTAARRDAAFGGDAGGGAGLCETVMGELAEGLMFGLCKGGVL